MASDSPLQGLYIAVSGTYAPLGYTQNTIGKRIEALGGTYTTYFNQTMAIPACRVVCTEASHDLLKADIIKAAVHNGIPLLSLDWIVACEKEAKEVDVSNYEWASLKAAGKRKRPVATETVNSKSAKQARVADDSESRPQAAVGQDTASETAAKGVAKGVEKDTNDTKVAVRSKPPVCVVAEGQYLKTKAVTLPADEYCHMKNSHLYVDPESGLIYDALLFKTVISMSQNKFYRVQVGTCSTMTPLQYY